MILLFNSYYNILHTIVFIAVKLCIKSCDRLRFFFFVSERNE